MRIKPLRVEVLRRRAHDLGANAQDGRLPRAADPEVAPLLQKVHAVFFQRDRIRIRLGHALHHLHIFDIELIAARRALVGPHFARDDHATIPG